MDRPGKNRKTKKMNQEPLLCNEDPPGTRLVIDTGAMDGAYGGAVAVARIPTEDLARFANTQGVRLVEVSWAAPNNGVGYESFDETATRLEARVLAAGYTLVEQEELDAETAADNGPMDDEWIHAAYERRADAGLPV